MARKKNDSVIYAAVCEMDGHKVYTSFDTDLQKLIDHAESYGFGIIEIEEAHSGKPPVWTRKKA